MKKFVAWWRLLVLATIASGRDGVLECPLTCATWSDGCNQYQCEGGKLVSLLTHNKCGVAQLLEDKTLPSRGHCIDSMRSAANDGPKGCTKGPTNYIWWQPRQGRRGGLRGAFACKQS